MTAPHVPPVHRSALLEIVPILVAMHMDAEVRYRQREGTQNLVAATDVVGVARISPGEVGRQIDTRVGLQRELPRRAVSYEVAPLRRDGS